MSLVTSVVADRRRFDVRVKAAVITLVVAGVSFPLTFVIWPSGVPASAPATAQALGYGLVIAESLAMGGGVAFLALAFPNVRLPVSPRLAFASYFGIGYFLINWWTHDHLHAVAEHLSFTGFIWMTTGIEYLFHVGMMVFAGVIALFFARTLIDTPSDQSTRRKLLVLVIAIALASIPTSLALFRPANLANGAALPTSVLPFLIGLKLFEGLALGTGIAFLIYGSRLIKRAGQLPTLTLLAFAAISWCLMSWWPHDNMHLVNGSNLWGLLAIEYGFHVTTMVAAGVLALFFYRMIGEHRKARA